MRQPVSRTTFDRRRGYLGVFLQEGAPFVDAVWNEGARIFGSLLRDAIVDGGLAGTSGRELRIDAVERDGQLADLVVRGGPGRFYCDGLPVQWPADRPFTVDGRAPGGMALDKMRAGVAYEVYLRAWVETVDRLDEPDLDDPGIAAERGSFRAQVRAEVLLGAPAMPPVRRTNVRLTVEGAYVAEVNGLYRVELIELWPGADPQASILWDGDGAATVAPVTDAAPQRARVVRIASTDGFDLGDFVRFDGAGVDRTLYEIVDRDTSSLTLRCHRCDRAVRSLAGWVGVSQRALGGDDFEVVVTAPTADAIVVEGDELSDLPAALQPPGPGPWLVDGVTEADRSFTLRLVPTGLVAPLDTVDDARATRLVKPAHVFDATVEVEDRPDWIAGDRVRLVGTPSQSAAVVATSFPEDRRVVTIERIAAPTGGTRPSVATLLLRLDQPLSFDHAAGAEVAPVRTIRARRFAGHQCRVPIDIGRRDASQGGRPYAPVSGYKLPSGLVLRLSVEEQAPVVVTGDGWSFAARVGGWVESRVVAEVEERDREGRVALARLTVGEQGYQLIDLRPVPAARAHHPWLAAIHAAAEGIAADLDGDAASAARQLALAAQWSRAQADLVPLLETFADAAAAPLAGDPTCARRLADLVLTAAEVVATDAPDETELDAIAVAMERLATAITLTKMVASSRNATVADASAVAAAGPKGGKP